VPWAFHFINIEEIPICKKIKLTPKIGCKPGEKLASFYKKLAPGIFY
jgi:hypothetical protein